MATLKDTIIYGSLNVLRKIKAKYVEAESFKGNVTGDLTGNVTGNLTGKVTGDVTGNLKGDVTGNLKGNVNGNLTGDVTGNLKGNVTGNLTGNVDGISENGKKIIIDTFTAGSALTRGDLVYLGDDNKWYKIAVGSSFSISAIIGVSLNAYAINTANVQICISGYVYYNVIGSATMQKNYNVYLESNYNSSGYMTIKKLTNDRDTVNLCNYMKIGRQASVDNYIYLAPNNNDIDAFCEISRINTKFSGTLTLINWAGVTAPFTQVISISDMTANSTPIIDLVVTDNAATAKNEIREWSKVHRIVTSAGKITAYCYGEKPTVNLNIQIKGV